MSKAVQLYTYRAFLPGESAIIDGDSLRMWIDLGFNTWRWVHIRLADIDAPELSGENAAAGQAARQFVIDWFASAETQVFLRSNELDKYGRVLGWVFRANGSLNTALLQSGNAVPYP